MPRAGQLQITNNKKLRIHDDVNAHFAINPESKNKKKSLAGLLTYSRS